MTGSNAVWAPDSSSDRVAVRIPLPPGPAVDPFGLAGPEGMVFCAEGRVRVGLGVGLSIDLPHGLASPVDVARAVGILAAVDVGERAPGAAPAEPDGAAVTSASAVVAFGALPFDRHAPATLVVPDLLYAADPDGSEWVTLLTDTSRRGPHSSYPTRPDELRHWLVERAGATRPSQHRQGVAPARITARSTDDAFRGMVASALRSIDGGELAKVVLARQVDVTMPDPIGIVDLLCRWHRLEPNCSVFSLPTPAGQFVGASPELLIERNGRRVRSRPLAGTSERQADAKESRGSGHLLRSKKDGNEHRLVVEAIEGVLAPLCDELDVPEGPALVHLHTITHLGTSLAGTLARGSDASVAGALPLVAALHPTPAVGGVPAAAAERCIVRLEPEPRGQYAGPVGVVDAEGNGTWVVGIRAMSVRGTEARLIAGVGVVAGSDPERELAEANLKLAAVFEALAPGQAFSTGDGPPIDAPRTGQAGRAVS
jgi:menaquinone-specific isochorismate synthase